MRRACALLLLLVSFPLEAQDPVFRTETNLALVRFHVVRKKFYVDDLKPEDIILLEDGKPRQITLLEGGRTRQRTVPVEMSDRHKFATSAQLPARQARMRAPPCTMTGHA